jgi:hypothetical protein
VTRPRRLEWLRAPDPPAGRWFARTFGLAVVAHLAANAPAHRGFDGGTALSLTSAVLGVVALALVVRPARALLGLCAALVVVSVWCEAPFLSNHWLLMGFVALAVLVSVFRRDAWSSLAPTARWVLLGFYCFAAFAKYNTGFLDPVASCGLFYANQSLGSFGLPTVSHENPLAWLTVVGPIATETSVPILLAFTRTRRIGVLVALCFHTVISLDLDQHFYDFTSVLVVLLCLFLPEETLADLETRAARMSLAFAASVAICVVVVAAAVAPPFEGTAAVLDVLPFVVWLPFAGWLIYRIARGGLAGVPLDMRLLSPLAGALMAVIIFNGLTPYLELKTAYGFNMYANLSTVAGESNHLVVRRTAHLADVQDTLLTVVRSNGPMLQAYADRGYLLPQRNLLDYLARHPSTTVVVRDESGVEQTLDVGDGVRQPLIVEKLQLFRAVDPQDPPRCQDVWLPAR